MPLQIQAASDIDVLVTHAGASFHRFRRATGFLAGPLLALFLAGFVFVRFSSDAPDDVLPRRLYAPVFFVPLLVLLAGGVLSAVRLYRMREAIASLLWARPLADVPGAFGCRMCGAPIGADGSRSATITCTYCRSANMVGPEISRKASALALADYSNHASEVIRRLGATGGTRDIRGRASWSAGWAIAVPLLVLLACLGGGRLVDRSLRQKVKPPRASTAYVLWQCPSESTAHVSKLLAPPPDNPCRAEDENWTRKQVTFAEVEAMPLVDCVIIDPHTVGPYRAEAKKQLGGSYSDGLGRNFFRVEDFFEHIQPCAVDGATVGVPHR